MVTSDTLEDWQIEVLDREAQALGPDIEAMIVCDRARRHGGRGVANPYARAQCVRWWNWRQAVLADAG